MGTNSGKTSGSDPGILSSVLDLIPLGILILDPEGEVFRSNRYADELLDLDTAELVEAREIRLAVAPLGDCQKAFEIDDDESLPLRDRIEVIRECVARANDGRYQAVIIQDLSSALGPESVSSRWNLTSTEARVACLLASGLTVDAIAEELGMATSTTRTHLRNIFSKTGAKRQADLVRILLRDMSSIDSSFTG